MENLLAARSQMAISLGFHIIFSCIGMVMPFFMSLSYWKYLKTKDSEYLELTKAWMKGVAILFATGAVSGTVLSFELGLLWPEFMKHAGPIFGMPFSWEGAAFFLEAIALGLFLYGFDRLPPKIHWFSSLMVGISGFLSGIFVVAANAWMNSPSGFTWTGEKAIDIDPVAAMFNDAWLSQSLHMQLAGTVATSVAVLGVHSLLVAKNIRPEFNKKAIKIVLPFFIFSSLLIPLSGDFSAKDVAKRQPIKLAAMEAHYETMTYAPLIIGGIPNEKEQRVNYAIEIPGLLSFLATGSFDSEVKGLKDFPPDEIPPVTITHFAFQIMIAIGSFLALLALITAYFFWIKKQSPRWLLKLLFLATPLGFIAVEAGWTVTEVGRQPWIIYKILKTSESVTPMPGIQYSLFFFTLIYIFLAITVSWLMWRQIKFVNKIGHTE